MPHDRRWSGPADRVRGRRGSGGPCVHDGRARSGRWPGRSARRNCGAAVHVGGAVTCRRHGVSNGGTVRCDHCSCADCRRKASTRRRLRPRARCPAGRPGRSDRRTWAGQAPRSRARAGNARRTWSNSCCAVVMGTRLTRCGASTQSAGPGSSRAGISSGECLLDKGAPGARHESAGAAMVRSNESEGRAQTARCHSVQHRLVDQRPLPASTPGPRRPAKQREVCCGQSAPEIRCRARASSSRPLSCRASGKILNTIDLTPGTRLRASSRNEQVVGAGARGLRVLLAAPAGDASPPAVVPAGRRADDGAVVVAGGLPALHRRRGGSRAASAPARTDPAGLHLPHALPQPRPA